MILAEFEDSPDETNGPFGWSSDMRELRHPLLSNTSAELETGSVKPRGRDMDTSC